jgi:hypothetical protein
MDANGDSREGDGVEEKKGDKTPELRGMQSE